MNFKRTQYQAIYKGRAIRITEDLLTGSLKSRRTCNNVFQTLKDNSYQHKFPSKHIWNIISNILFECNGIKLVTKSNIHNFVEVEQHTTEWLMKKEIKIFLEMN